MNRRPPLLRTAAIIGAAAVVLGACSSPSKASDPLQRGTLSADPGPVSTTAPATGIRAQPLTVLSSQQAEGLISLPWSLVRLADGGRSLAIGYIAGGGCTRWAGIEVTETDTSVALAALARTTAASANLVCTADLALGATTVALSAPLGSRKLLHAEVDPAWRTYTQQLS